MLDFDYQSIERPYNSLMERTADEIVSGLGIPEMGGGGAASQPSINSPSQVNDNVINGSTVGDLWISNFIKSRNFQPKSRGFWLDGATGYAEFSNIFVTGSITGATINVPDEDTTEASVHINATGQTWWGATTTQWNADHENAEAYILPTGEAHFKNVVLSTDVTLSGLQPGSEISIQGWQFDAVFSSSDLDTVTWTNGSLKLLDGTTYAILSGNTSNMAALTYIYLDIAVSTTALQTTTTAINAVGTGKILIGVAEPSTTEATFQVFGGAGGNKITGADIESGSITSIRTKPAIQGWQFTGVFSAYDLNTVQWTSGALTLSNGVAYAIVAGETGNMTAKTYIYFDLGVSTTVLQTSTVAANAVGDNKILIAVAKTGTDEASFFVFGGSGGINLDGADIAVNSITANEIAANTITANEILANTITANEIAFGTITGNKIAANTINADRIISNSITALQIAAGTITASRIAANTITANEIAANTITTAKLLATAIDGMTITGATFRTAASGSRVVMDSSGIYSFAGVTQRVFIRNNGSGWFGTPTAFAWDTAGNLTATSITITGASQVYGATLANNIATGNSSRSVASGSGTQSVVVGWQPKVIQIIAETHQDIGSGYGLHSTGTSNGTTSQSIYSTSGFFPVAGGNGIDTTRVISLNFPPGTMYWSATVSFTATGFSLSWSLGGAGQSCNFTWIAYA